MAKKKGRRLGLYFSWSRPDEIGDLKALGTLENRYPTLFEFRRAIWPHYERFSDPKRYRQDVAGFLDHVVRMDFEPFEQLVKAVTNHDVGVIQRMDDKPPAREIDDQLLADFDTLIVVSLDHFRTKQVASPAEVQAIGGFLRRGGCLVVCPHHDVGAPGDLPAQRREHEHHGDPLVPAQQQIGGFARSLLAALGFPIENRFGLSPAAVAGEPAPLLVRQDLDSRGVLEGVTTFNLHPHLPHLFVPPSISDKVGVLARQAINPAAQSHPFVDEGNRHLNAFLHVPPSGDRAGDIFVGDATLWSAAFGGSASLKKLWENIATLRPAG